MKVPRSTVACTIPFTLMQVSPKGEVFLCCPAWTKYGSVGRLNQATSLDEIWNNASSRSVRERIYANDQVKICNADLCPYFKNNKPVILETKDPTYKDVYREIRQGHTRLNSAPRTLLLAHSGRCNLRCIMCCSNERYVKEDPGLNALVFQRELPRMLPRLAEIILTGNGDPFFMKDTREFMQHFDPQKYPNIKLSITTNGLLFNEAMWQTIRHNKFGWISVSVDAATKKTYEYIRRGGRWEILQRNLQLISALRKQKVFSSFTISFVVMRSNYQEMKKFVEMGLRLGADTILFQKIFGTVGIKENINLTRNKRTFKEIAKILSDPLFKNRRVDTTTIQDYQKYRMQKITLFDDLTPTFIVKAFQLVRYTKDTKDHVFLRTAAGTP